jgi:hypothetical protein
VNAMRLILAGLFVSVTSGAVFVFLFFIVPEAVRGVLGYCWFGTMILMSLAALYIFNLPEDRFLEFRSSEYRIQRLAAKGLLVSSAFRARRAFEVKELGGEGPHYFIELADGKVLYLNGPYLRSYEPITDELGLNQPRAFPCTDFTIRRHKNRGYIVDIVCGGNVLEPEVTAPAFKRSDFRLGVVPEDGQRLTDRTYEQVKNERIKTGE